MLTDFRGKFSAIQREYSPNPRKFYGFCTSVIVNTHDILAFGILTDVLITLLGYDDNSRNPC